MANGFADSLIKRAGLLTYKTEITLTMQNDEHECSYNGKMDPSLGLTPEKLCTFVTSNFDLNFWYQNPAWYTSSTVASVDSQANVNWIPQPTPGLWLVLSSTISQVAITSQTLPCGQLAPIATCSRSLLRHVVSHLKSVSGKSDMK